jgi:hypothetical protein
MSIITELTSKELVLIYNLLSAVHVTKFKELKVGQARVHGLTADHPENLLKAMKDLAIRPDLCEKLAKDLEKKSKKGQASPLPATEVVEAPPATPLAADEPFEAPAPSLVELFDKALVGYEKLLVEGLGRPAAFVKSAIDSWRAKGATQASLDRLCAATEEASAAIKAKPTIKQDNRAGEHPADPGTPARREGDGTEEEGWDALVAPLRQIQAEARAQEEAVVGAIPRKEVRAKAPKGSRAFTILWNIQNIIKEQEAAGEDQVTTSTEVAKRATTSTTEVVKQLQFLKTTELVELEDDTTGQAGDEPFYYITLLPKGAAQDCKDILVPGKTPRLPGVASGPRSPKSGKKIYKLVPSNPRKEGSWGWKSFNVITDGITYEDYIRLGGRPQDLAWDEDHKFVEIK